MSLRETKSVPISLSLQFFCRPFCKYFEIAAFLYEATTNIIILVEIFGSKLFAIGCFPHFYQRKLQQDIRTYSSILSSHQNILSLANWNSLPPLHFSSRQKQVE